MGYVVWFSLGNLRIVASRNAAALRLNVGSLGQISESFVEVHKSVCCAQMSDIFVLSKGTGLVHSFLIPAGTHDSSECWARLRTRRHQGERGCLLYNGSAALFPVPFRGKLQQQLENPQVKQNPDPFSSRSGAPR